MKDLCVVCGGVVGTSRWIQEGDRDGEGHVELSEGHRGIALGCLRDGRYERYPNVQPILFSDDSCCGGHHICPGCATRDDVENLLSRAYGCAHRAIWIIPLLVNPEALGDLLARADHDIEELREHIKTTRKELEIRLAQACKKRARIATLLGLPSSTDPAADESPTRASRIQAM